MFSRVIDRRVDKQGTVLYVIDGCHLHREDGPARICGDIILPAGQSLLGWHDYWLYGIPMGCCPERLYEKRMALKPASRILASIHGTVGMVGWLIDYLEEEDSELAANIRARKVRTKEFLENWPEDPGMYGHHRWI